MSIRLARLGHASAMPLDTLRVICPQVHLASWPAWRCRRNLLCVLAWSWRDGDLNESCAAARGTGQENQGPRKGTTSVGPMSTEVALMSNCKLCCKRAVQPRRPSAQVPRCPAAAALPSARPGAATIRTTCWSCDWGGQGESRAAGVQNPELAGLLTGHDWAADCGLPLCSWACLKTWRRWASRKLNPGNAPRVTAGPQVCLSLFI